MRTIRGVPWRQRVLWVTLGVLFAAGVLGVLVPYFGGSWVGYFFALLPFVVSGVFVLASAGSGTSERGDRATSS
ncbi:hypothetical protein [Nocardiopsis sp. MG754419]|uniref:hypothetical protein n=1 Tax=Nocardiopsis sp. MG754419 TaxID=2259865 RepID=UPI001BA850CF|nr:hypothetical protein [Nocardiopsis sp. MG754419]MBR8741076.1 hypothetical protein [Nocardiopsis sp. MG754419]